MSPRKSGTYTPTVVIESSLVEGGCSSVVPLTTHLETPRPPSRPSNPIGGTAPAGESLAGLYALVATCEGNSLNPEDYFSNDGLAPKECPRLAYNSGRGVSMPHGHAIVPSASAAG